MARGLSLVLAMLFLSTGWAQTPVPVVDLAGVWQGVVPIPASGIPLRPVTYRLIVERETDPEVRLQSGDLNVVIDYNAKVEVTGYRPVALNTFVPCYRNYADLTIGGEDSTAVTFLNPTQNGAGQVFTATINLNVTGPTSLSRWHHRLE